MHQIGDDPALSELLHPSPGLRNRLSAPEKGKLAVPKNAEKALSWLL
jgi:hypothetical protein